MTDAPPLLLTSARIRPLFISKVPGLGQFIPIQSILILEGCRISNVRPLVLTSSLGERLRANWGPHILCTLPVNIYMPGGVPHADGQLSIQVRDITRLLQQQVS